ncbi:MAG TPA: methyltransferase, partial [Thermoanaerobaculia bacterium]|nr:methyltransferase [Thermoanaerobaculia bacterium]
ARIGYRVVAVDLNPQAVRCVRANAVLHGLEERIEARQGDLFAPVAGERFDLVLWNPPYFRGAPRNPLDAAWRSVDALERFAAGLPAALAPGGRALVVLSTDGDCAAQLAAHREGGMEVGVATRRDFGNEVVTVHTVSAPRPAAAAAREGARSEPGRLHAQGAGA